MIAPLPATLAPEIYEELGVILRSGGRLYDVSDARWNALLEKTDKLQKVDAIIASSFKATLYSLVGDIDQARYWVKNMRLNGEKVLSDETESHCLANLGFASQAAQLFPRVVDLQRGRVNMYLHRGLTCGSFKALIGAAEALEKAGGELEPMNVPLLEVARLADTALAQLAVPEANLQRMMDAAGTIMRTKKLLWLDDTPDIDASAGPGAHVALRYRVTISPDEAAGLNWDLAEALAEADLMPMGVTVSFTGVQDKVFALAA